MRKYLVTMAAAMMATSMMLTGCNIGKQAESTAKVQTKEVKYSNSDFTKGNKDAQEFLNKINADTAKYQGVCGPDTRWYYLDNVIVVKGTGAVNQNTWFDSFVEGWNVKESELPVWVFFDEGITEINTSLSKGYSNNKLVKIVLPTTLVRIDEGAFSGCVALEKIALPKGLEVIGKDAFRSCGLTSLSIPDSVTEIGEGAFSSCESIEAVRIPDGVKSIGDRSFLYCSALVDVDLPDGLESIGYEAFENCESLTDIVIPESVTEIGWSAFWDCSNLGRIKIQSVALDVSHITNKNNLEFPDNSRYYVENGVLIDAQNKKIVQAFDTFDENIGIPAGIEVIGNAAFSNCSGLTNIVIPNSVSRIESDAFGSCKNLESVFISGSVTSIENSTFYGCEKLTNIVIPESVTYIGTWAFGYCTNLTSVVIPRSVVTIDINAFGECKKMEELHIPAHFEGQDLCNIGYTRNLIYY